MLLSINARFLTQNITEVQRWQLTALYEGNSMKKCYQDLQMLKQKYNVSYLMGILSNKGFHALLIYRISNFLFMHKIPLVPLVLTRIIQIFYSIDCHLSKCTRILLSTYFAFLMLFCGMNT